jgi:hypothetical protein
LNYFSKAKNEATMQIRIEIKKTNKVQEEAVYQATAKDRVFPSFSCGDRESFLLKECLCSFQDKRREIHIHPSLSEGSNLLDERIL